MQRAERKAGRDMGGPSRGDAGSLRVKKNVVKRHCRHDAAILREDFGCGRVRVERACVPCAETVLMFKDAVVDSVSGEGIFFPGSLSADDAISIRILRDIEVIRTVWLTAVLPAPPA